MQNTDPSYSPWTLLPAPEPRTVFPPVDQFYHTVAKHLVRDTVRIMANGLAIDLDKVEELENNLENQLKSVHEKLAANPYVQKFLEHEFKQQVSLFIKEKQTKFKTASDFLKPFKASDPIHRSYFMHIFSQQQGFSEPTELLPSGVPKWSVNTIKKLANSYPVLNRLLNGSIDINHPIAIKAMELLATHKANMYNSKYLKAIENSVNICSQDYPKFNPGSSKQIREFFAFYGVKSENFSKKTNQPTFDRNELERLQKEVTDEYILDVINQLLEFSNAAIIQNNFIKSFYKYTINGRLYGQYKLLGAKSGRYTSSSPNMLNAPSTGSIFAKAVKACFKAPPGRIICAVDLAGLEDRVMANLSKDKNKLALFLENLDGHSLSATYFYPERVASIIGPYTDHKEASKLLKAAVDEGNKEAKAVRQDSKPVSFGLSYGAYPKKIANTIKISLQEAEAIFNAYHNELYPGITDYRENYVLPTAKAYGKLHLGLGFYIHTDDPERDIRTLNNATCQFWSILTPLTINYMHKLIDEAGLTNNIIITSTIYDSIYLECDADASIIKWVNDHIIPTITVDYIENQIVHNEAALDIGPSWADLTTIPNNATIEQIEEVLKTINDKIHI